MGIASQITQPNLPKQLPQAGALSKLEPGLTLEGVECAEVAWAGQKSKLAHIDSVRLIDPDLTTAVLRQGGWEDVEISGGQLGGLNLTGSSLRRVLIQRARMSGVVLAETELKDITIEDTKLDLANFRFAKLSRIQFVRCQLIDADFGASQLVDVDFTNCDLTSADFSGATLKRVDLRSSTVQQIKGIGGLKGATINYDQMITLVPELAAGLGIEVKND
jgi:uncharacterized protein YjbI with pentapeptide repeats